jgi:hypothetical protein
VSGVSCTSGNVVVINGQNGGGSSSSGDPEGGTEIVTQVLITDRPQTTVVVGVVNQNRPTGGGSDSSDSDPDSFLPAEDEVDRMTVLSGPIEELTPSDEVVRVLDFEQLTWSISRAQNDVVININHSSFAYVAGVGVAPPTTVRVLQYVFFEDATHVQHGTSAFMQAGDSKLGIEIISWPFLNVENRLRLYLNYTTNKTVGGGGGGGGMCLHAVVVGGGSGWWRVNACAAHGICLAVYPRLCKMRVLPYCFPSHHSLDVHFVSRQLIANPDDDLCDSTDVDPNLVQNLTGVPAALSENFLSMELHSNSGISFRIGLSNVSVADGQLVAIEYLAYSNGNVQLTFDYFNDKLGYDPSLRALFGDKDGRLGDCWVVRFWCSLAVLSSALCALGLSCALYHLSADVRPLFRVASM